MPLPYTLNTTVCQLDEAAAEVLFEVTNFKKAIRLNPNGTFLRSKAFCIEGGMFCLKVYPSGVKGEPGKVSAYLMNMTDIDFEITLQMSLKEETYAVNIGKIEANKTIGWKSVEEAGKIGNTLVLLARVYVWKFENNNVLESRREELMTKTEKMEVLTKEDLKSQMKQIQSWVKTEVEPMKSEMKQMTTEGKQVKAEVMQMKDEMKNVKTEVIKIKAETKTEVLNLNSEVVKLKKELMTEVKSEVIKIKAEE